MADFNKQRTGSRELERIQDIGKENFERNLPPWVRDGKELDVSLNAGVVMVPHGLKRVPRGWLFHSAKGDPYAILETTKNDREIGLINGYVGSSEVTGKLWIW